MGLSALLVSDYSGNPEPLHVERVTVGSTFFMHFNDMKINVFTAIVLIIIITTYGYLPCLYAQVPNRTVYICTNQGKKYHIQKDCHLLGNCKYTPTAITLQQAIEGYHTEKGIIKFTPCKVCSRSLSKVVDKKKSIVKQPTHAQPGNSYNDRYKNGKKNAKVECLDKLK